MIHLARRIRSTALLASAVLAGASCARSPAPLEVGTVLFASSAERLSSELNHVGDTLHAHLVRDALNDQGVVIVPDRAEIVLVIDTIAPAPAGSDRGILQLSARTVEFGGRTYALNAGVSSYEYELKSRLVGGDTIRDIVLHPSGRVNLKLGERFAR